MDDKVFDFIKSEIEYAEGDVSEAAFFMYDALSKGYDNELSKLLGLSGKIDERKAYSLVFGLYNEVYSDISKTVNELASHKLISRQWIIDQAKIENGCEISAGITEDFIQLRDKSKFRTELPKWDL